MSTLPRTSTHVRTGSLPVLLTIFVSCALALRFTACREDQGITPAVPSAPFEGITSTDASGGILTIDSTDWQPVPAVGTTVSPAYPNPCVSTFNLFFRMGATDSIEITLNPSANTVWEVIATGTYGQGQHQVIGHVETFPAGIYRVYFNVFRSGRTYKTYGDVQVSR